MTGFNSAREIAESIARKQHEQRVRVDNQGKPVEELKPRHYDSYGRLLLEKADEA